MSPASQSQVTSRYASPSIITRVLGQVGRVGWELANLADANGFPLFVFKHFGFVKTPNTLSPGHFFHSFFKLMCMSREI